MQNVGWATIFFILLLHFSVHDLSHLIFVGTPCITDCVMAELEKLGQKYRVALRHVLCPRLYTFVLDIPFN